MERQKENSKKRQYSLRFILIFCFFILSFVPLVLLSFYSVNIFERGIDRELLQRVELAESLIKSRLKERGAFLEKGLASMNDNKPLLFYITSDNKEELLTLIQNRLFIEGVDFIRFYNNQGEAIHGYYLNENKVTTAQSFLSLDFMERLRVGQSLKKIKRNRENLQVSRFLRLNSENDITVGFAEVSYFINSDFLQRLSERYNIHYAVESMWKIKSLKSSFTIENKIDLKKLTQSLSSLNLNGKSYRGKKFPLKIGENDITFLTIVPTFFVQRVVENLRQALIIIVIMLTLFIGVVSIFITSQILKPINNLIRATNNPDFERPNIEIEDAFETEIGVLTENFNLMFKKVHVAQTDLKSKIQELEKANKTIKSTQVKLVHSAKMISLGELVAGVAHELNNPIGFIYSNVSHLKSYMDSLVDIIRTGEKNPEQIAEKKKEHEFDYIVSDLPKLIRSCEDGAQRTKDIVLGLRNFSRLDEAQQKEIQINQALENTLNLLKSQFKNRIQVIKDFDEEIQSFLCFPSQLNQVFMNILSNAFHAIENKGKVYLTTEHKESFITVSIRDTGSGIEDDILDKIFDPFFTTKGQGEGTGLGLSISYSIIQKHQGDIIVKSQKGKGTEFIIQLPYLDSQGEPK